MPCTNYMETPRLRAVVGVGGSGKDGSEAWAEQTRKKEGSPSLKRMDQALIMIAGRGGGDGGAGEEADGAFLAACMWAVEEEASEAFPTARMRAAATATERRKRLEVSRQRVCGAHAGEAEVAAGCSLAMCKQWGERVSRRQYTRATMDGNSQLAAAHSHGNRAEESISDSMLVRRRRARRDGLARGSPLCICMRSHEGGREGRGWTKEAVMEEVVPVLVHQEQGEGCWWGRRRQQGSLLYTSQRGRGRRQGLLCVRRLAAGSSLRCVSGCRRGGQRGAHTTEEEKVEGVPRRACRGRW